MRSLIAKFLALPLLVAVYGCTTDSVLPAAQLGGFDPIVFFSGHTHGEGELNKLLSKAVHVSVDGYGRLGDEGLILDQAVREGDGASNTRRWTIRRIAADKYSGTLTDAVGPVTGQVVGPRAYIRYTMKHGLKVEQQLAQQSDGKTVLNRLVVYKFGVRVATLTETIKKLAP